MELLFDRRHSQSKNKANADTVYVLCPPPPSVALFAAAVSVFGVSWPSPDQIKEVQIALHYFEYNGFHSTFVFLICTLPFKNYETRKT